MSAQWGGSARVEESDTFSKIMLYLWLATMLVSLVIQILGGK